MSTREIAELTGKRHDHVLYDTRKMLADLGKDAPEFSGSSQVPGPYGRMVEVPVFNLPKDLTLTLVSGYNVQMRHRIITRWLELSSEVRAVGGASVPAGDVGLFPRVTPRRWLWRLAQELVRKEDTQAAEHEAAPPTGHLGEECPHHLPREEQDTEDSRPPHGATFWSHSSFTPRSYPTP